MKLTTMTQVTVDGVMQGNGGVSDEDRRNGFERGGWAMGKGDDETMAFITQTYQRADAFLFGRRTYEIFAGSWGAIAEMRAHPIGVALNETPKYVASTTLTDPQWADTTVLSGDLAAAVVELKARPGDRLKHVTARTTGDDLQMQYLVSVIDDTAGLATQDEMAAIDVFNDRLKAEGHWVFAGGLGSPGTATVIDNRRDEPIFTDGPFLESKEYLAGFWIIEAPDLDVALKLAAAGSKACNRRIEVRPFR